MTLPFHVPLTADQQVAAGLPASWPLAIADKVRFAELDPLNHVNNAAYMTWYETIRIRYMLDWGLSTYSSADDPRIVIMRAEINYLKEMLQDETYVVTARTTAFRNTSFTMESQIWSGDLRSTFSCVIVTLEPDGSGKRALPDAVRQRFVEVDGATG